MASDRPMILGALSIRGGFFVVVYDAKQVGGSPGLRGLSSLRSCEDFLCAKGPRIMCHDLLPPALNPLVLNS